MNLTQLAKDIFFIFLVFGTFATAVTVAHWRSGDLQQHVQHSQTFADRCVAYWQNDIDLTATEAAACDQWRNPGDR